jgi:hypothetical protein
MARKPTSKPLLVTRLFEPVREHERPWLMAFEPLLRAALIANDAEPDDVVTKGVALFAEQVEQGV